MKLLRLLSDLIIKKRNLKRIKNFMKYIVILLLIAFVSNAQITKLNLMPWPQDITLTSGTSHNQTIQSQY
jgi:multisubunit Na+/H+ antiporter MnhE subunit